ncbi:MAG: trigger factor [Cyanothece sp. SIO2G6]|nr:trigger factor [Cyanothece sp. SIO2G6]
MKVTQEKLPASQIGLSVEIDADVSQKAYERTLRDYMSQANIPGFRRGKVPRKVLIQRFGAKRIKATVLEKLVQDTLEAAIKQEKIEVLGNLELRSPFEELVDQFTPGESITISASVDVPPEVKISQYSGLTLQAEEAKYDAEQVDTILEDYRNRTATLVPIEDRPAAMGDTVIVDFDGVLAQGDGETGEPSPVPGGQAQDFQVDLETGKFIPGFIDGIVGMSLGETKQISATFPENYPEESVSGQDAIFTVTLKELKEKELPDLDDDFAQDVSEYDTLAELRQSLEDRVKADVEKKLTENIASVVLTKLVELVETELPESMVEQECNVLVNQTVMQLEQQGIEIKKMMTQDMLKNMQQGTRPDAITQIKKRLAIRQVAEQEGVKVADDALEAKVNEFVKEYGDRNIDMARLRQFLEEDLLQEQVLTWFKENNTVELVEAGSLDSGAGAESSADAPASEPDPVEGNATVDVDAVDVDAVDVDAVDVDAEAEDKPTD